ncbi:MAG TPA: hypothetical protein VHQ90_23590 [Thermoanaerobaculia bacterium]|nr:hypothetical protein [Thermoanaerobaculia bacterium]
MPAALVAIAVACAGAASGEARAAAGPALFAAGPPIPLQGAGTVAAVAAAPDGSLEIASVDTSGGPQFSLFVSTVHLQHFGPDGTPAGGEQTPSQLTGLGHNQVRPAITALSPDGFAVAWEVRSNIPPLPFGGASTPLANGSPAAAGDPYTISARLLDAAGRPQGNEIQVSPSGGLPAIDVRLAGLASGGFVVSWLRGLNSLGFDLVFRRFDASGQPLSAEAPVVIGFALRNLGVAALADGGFVTAWGQFGQGLFFQRFDAAGTAVGTAVQAVTGDAGGPAALAANPAGRLAFAWMTSNPFLQPQGSVLVRLFDVAGNPLGPPLTVAEQGPVSHPVLADLAMDLGGRTMVAWTNMIGSPLHDFALNAFAQLIDATGAPLGKPVKVDDSSAGFHQAQQVFAGGDGSWHVLWAGSGGELLQGYRTDGCAPDPGSLCLEANRFRLDVQFRDPRSGGLGAGHPVPLTAQTGTLWFFGADDPELIVKMVDGTAVNGHHWLFYASLSDVEFDLTATDTTTGEKRVYHNPAGTLASLADTQAFPLTRAAGAGGAAVAMPAGGSSQAATQSPKSPGGVPAAGLASADGSGAVVPLAAADPCHGLPESLCLTRSRFSVAVAWREPRSGRSGAGEAVQLYPGGGYFWFFGPNDFELAVKLLDGTPVNGHFWVFYASLTDVEFDLTVTDNFSPTRAGRTYHNPPFHLASAADTEAF